MTSYRYNILNTQEYSTLNWRERALLLEGIDDTYGKYLDYVNDFLTLEGFANYYGYTYNQALEIYNRHKEK